MKTTIDAEMVEITCKVNEVFKDYGKTALWLRTDNPNFGGISPIKLINWGKGKKVLEMIKSAKDSE